MNMILKNKIIKIKLYSKDFVILKIFINLNIVKSVKKIKNKKYLYIITINCDSMFCNIINLYKPSKLVTISLKELIKVNKKRSSIFYLSTNKGVINCFDAEKNNVGGLLIMNVWV